MTTTLRVTLPAGTVILETERDWPECVDFVRQAMFGDLPAKDDRFVKAMKIQNRKDAE